MYKMWFNIISTLQGPDSIQRCRLTSKENPIVEIGWSYDHLISTMRFPILVSRHLYTESGPRCWNWNIPGQLGQYHGSLYLGCLCPCLPWERISSACIVSVFRNNRKYKLIFVFPHKKSTLQGFKIYQNSWAEIKSLSWLKAALKSP